MNDEIFDREMAAFKIIQRRIEQMLEDGYEMRMYDNAPGAMFEMMFVGPVKGSERSDVQTLKLPFEVMASLLYDDPGAAEQWQQLLAKQQQANRNIYTFVRSIMENKIGGQNDDGSNGEQGGEKRLH